MKILYATMQFGRDYAQGTERYVAMLAAGMRERGHAVAILAGDPERHGPRRRLGERVQDDPPVLYYPTRGWMSVEGLPARELSGLLDREKPDIVHVANPAHIGIGLMVAARQRGIPVIVTVMDFWWLCPKHTLFHASGTICDANVTWKQCVRCMGASDARAWVRQLAGVPAIGTAMLTGLYSVRALGRGATVAELARWTQRQRIVLDALRQADAVIFPSRGARERLGPRVDSARAHSIPYGLEQRWFDAARSRPIEAPADPARLTLGYAGALAVHKGPHLLLEAVRQLGWTQTRIRIAGGGTDAHYIERLHQLAAGLNVEFVGRVESADMPAFLRELDLFVMPSTWPENLPIVVLETQAVGTPVMASAIDGVTETVPEPMRFKTGSSADLARCLNQWVSHPANPPPLQPVSTAEAMVARTAEVYAQALVGRCPGPISRNHPVEPVQVGNGNSR
ncbi:MAG TPA: glycosyltransferase [Phycisphaerae bacterium]|nr:glycosyltransferase [Phycisphaerae bacterium]HPZ99378.1 glycosyltransferase [Phycisphaerae bacterium]HQE29291.1 glycosyltransferase [Phycisphaerae bacterium]